MAVKTIDGVLGDLRPIDPKNIIFAEKTKDALFWNARTHFGAEEIGHLREAIRTEGLLKEILVRKIGADKYQVIAGERRLRSILKLLEKDVECYDLKTGNWVGSQKLYKVIIAKVLENCSDKVASKLSISENLNHQSLSEYELMEYCRELEEKLDDKKEPAYSRKDIAEIIGRKEAWISQTMSLYKLNDEAKKQLQDGTLPRTVALGLLKIKEDGANVSRVLRLASKLAKEDQMKTKERMQKEIDDLHGLLEKCDLELSVTTEMGSEHEVREVKKARTELNKKLESVQERKNNASASQPRLSIDTIERATDQLGVRKGKNQGMSPKAIRTTLADIEEHLKKDEPIFSHDGLDIARRDLGLLAMAFKMALGQITERDPLKVLQNLYLEEQESLQEVS